METPDPPTLVLDSTRVTDVLATARPGQNVLAVLAERSSGEWRREWAREVRWEPAQTGIVETYELARSTATAPEPETLVVDDDLAVTQLGRPVETDDVLPVIGQYLDGWDGGQASTLVYVDSLVDLVDDGEGVPAAFLEEVLARAQSVGASVYAHLDPEQVSPAELLNATAAFERVVGEPVVSPEVEAAIQRLRADEPTNFGYARRHWREAMAGLDAVDRTYPQARQVHAALTDPESTPRTLGAALKALETLDVLDLWGDTVGPNRYDLRAYDVDRLAAVGLALDRLD